jgi:hypothetical protein
MIAAAALHAGCDTLWSEGMQHGMAIEGRLRIVNPFSRCGLTVDRAKRQHLALRRRSD